MDSLFDAGFNGAARSELYRSLVASDIFPHEKPMRLENWSDDDLEMYCGGVFTPGYQVKGKCV